jgi:cytoskeletal protein RodZ
MSLINDALKKSHKDSTGKIVMPAAPRKKRNEPGNLPAVRPSSLKRKATITLIAAICCLGVIVAVIVADGNYDSAKTLFSSLRSQVVQLVTNVTSSTSSAKTQSQTPKKGIAENTIQSQPEQTDTLSLVGKSEQGKSIPVPQAGDQATAAPSQPGK